MKQLDDRILLKDILDNARRALTAVSGRQRDDLDEGQRPPGFADVCIGRCTQKGTQVYFILRPVLVASEDFERDQVLMSAVVLGELHAGFKGGSRERENVELLEDFLRRPAVRTVDVTRATAEVFGVVKQTLKKAGAPIPINDVWIAAHAIETGSWLLPYDHHFTSVPGILLWDRIGKA